MILTGSWTCYRAAGQVPVNPDSILLVTDPVTGAVGYLMPEIAGEHYRFLFRYCSQAESLFRTYSSQVRLLKDQRDNLRSQGAAQTLVIQNQTMQIGILEDDLAITKAAVKAVDKSRLREKRLKNLWKTVAMVTPLAAGILYLTR
jgi:hypothetical protein